jgi:hypothetical protein
MNPGLFPIYLGRQHAQRAPACRACRLLGCAVGAQQREAGVGCGDERPG